MLIGKGLSEPEEHRDWVAIRPQSNRGDSRGVHPQACGLRALFWGSLPENSLSVPFLAREMGPGKRE